MRVSRPFVSMAVLLMAQSQCAPLHAFTGAADSITSTLSAAPFVGRLSKSLFGRSTYPADISLKLNHINLEVEPTPSAAHTPLISPAVSFIGALAKRSFSDFSSPFGSLGNFAQGMPEFGSFSNFPWIDSASNLGNMPGGLVPGLSSVKSFASGKSMPDLSSFSDFLKKRDLSSPLSSFTNVAQGIPGLSSLSSFPSFGSFPTFRSIPSFSFNRFTDAIPDFSSISGVPSPAGMLGGSFI